MKFLSSVATGALSGSVGGTTASRNRAGPYLRQRSIPTNPNTIQQQAVRSALSALSAGWVALLSAAQREAWDTYAENVLIPDALGTPVNVGGVGMYIRSNVPRIQSGIADLPQVDDAPTIFNLGEYTLPVVASITASTGILSLEFTDTDEWIDEDEAGLLIFASRGQNPSRNYFKNPYRYADVVLGDSTTPETSPVAITLPFTVAVGQKVFVRGLVTRADGRLSADFRVHGIAV